ncbi:autophagy- protein 2 [Gnomoniopsis smithogilvyi]|uniref:Autophagy-related protein 2 n=1 Tax=Gnomoniopsis smithogilvyi TaxID=1191159 RepID=A0A9W8Z1M9_9PEZI|nr:autophagy- protein 2 [Gnomoniopsis smithogilvyi]
MAGIFTSFRTSAMPKRLLRYAMAKFDIFEDDALDLENLDLGFGFKNLFEFKDVGLKVDKLTKQLALPAEYRIKKAKVSRLQITVPLDLYSSSIELVATGVHISLEVSSSDPREKASSTRKEKEPAREDLVPTAADLAQSFLETQPNQERRALEEALAAEKQDLGASVTSSEDGSEDDLAFGTGQGLSLPVFLTDFLQGVVDRTRVTIKDVALNLDIEIPVEPKAAETELVSIRLSLDELHVEGVTTQIQQDGDSKIVPKEGKRHILLSDIRASLITQAEVFSSLTRSPSMVSDTSKSPLTTQRSPTIAAKSFAPSGASSTTSILASSDRASSPRTLEDSEDALQIPYDMDDFRGAGDDQGLQEPRSSLSTPRASIYHEFSGPAEISAQLSTPNEEPLTWSSMLNSPTTSQNLQPDEGSLEKFSSSDSESDESEAHRSEDLSQSQYFSHDQAESMYMSAFSEAQSQRIPRESLPGSWGVDPSPRTSPDTSPRHLHSASPHVTSSGQEDTDTHLDEAAPSSAFPPAKVEATTNQPVPTEVTPRPSTDNLAHEAATQGPTKLVKEIVSLESISIYIPTRHKHIYVSTADRTAPMAESAVHNVPGAFSVHSAMPESTFEPEDDPGTTNNEDSGADSIEVHLAPLVLQFDTSVGFLLAVVVQKLLQASQRRSEAPPEKVDAVPNQVAAESVPNMMFSIQKISILFMEQIIGVANNVTRTPEFATPLHNPLLRAELENLSGNITQATSSKEAKFNLQRFCFGYHDSNIISFDQSLEMRKSVLTNVLEAGSDVSVQVTMKQDSTLCEVHTLPLRVMVDLQRLDETFTWFGGLSGFLHMGASMTSNTSYGKPAVKHPKPRGVRFDLPVQPVSEGKVHESMTSVRIEGLQLDLLGKMCGISVTTSAVNVTHQAHKLRLHITKLEASGPHKKASSTEPPVAIHVTNTRLTFLNSPRDSDLDRLLALIVPSEGQFDDDDDEIMVDTLLRQRRKGSVLDLEVGRVKVQMNQLYQLDSIPALVEEISRLGAVAKYLPEDDRPGLLTLALVHSVEAMVDIGGRIGYVDATATGFEVAHITFPALVAFAVKSVKVERNGIEELIGSASGPDSDLPTQPPALMARMIADQMEPVIKVRMRNVNIEYRVPTVMDLLDLSSESTPQEFDAMLAASVANLGDKAHHALAGAEPLYQQAPSASRTEQAKPTVINVGFRDCYIGLNPLGLTSKLAIMLIDTNVEIGMPADSDVNVVADLKRMALLLIDDVSLLETADEGPGLSRTRESDARKRMGMVSTLCSKGFVDICQIQAAKVTAHVRPGAQGQKHVDIELRDKLLVLETCADSTHTLIALAGALKPPTPPSRELEYDTQPMPIQDLMASVTENFFGTAEGAYNIDEDFAMTTDSIGGYSSDGELIDGTPLAMRPRFSSGEQEVAECMFDATTSSILSNPAPMANIDLMVDSEVRVQNDFFSTGPPPDMIAHHWHSNSNSYEEVDAATLRDSPVKVRVRDVHVIWHLFDGYDWQHTRNAITKNVEEVETQAFERRARSGRRSLDEPDSEDEDVIGDCLFNSIYVSIPARNDPRGLVGDINRQLDDDASVAATTVTTATTRTGTAQFRSRSKKLKLGRSKTHKIAFELSGLNVDLVQFAPPQDQKSFSSGQTEFAPGQTLASIDLRVNNLEIFDRLPTSTWKKFATYDMDAGERELGTNMVHVELVALKTKSHLAAVENVLRATVLPLRLHVDQDALDFITRFFQFKDDSQTPAHTSPSDEAFIQRAEINEIPVTLDFKPKRVDYTGLRGGRTSEFMNFVNLEGSRLKLRRIITYGVKGWETLGNLLNDTWTPDVKKTQLGGVLAGVGPTRHFVNVGSGLRDLIEIPIKEYQKDGRLVRGIGMGAAAFAQKTGTEIVKLGAKVAIGTQNVLQNAEGMLTGTSGAGEPMPIQVGWEDDDTDAEEKKQISLYADQPTGVAQGLRSAYSSLARDLSTARDAIIAVPTEVMESGNARGAAAAVLKRAPTIIFRPAIGASRAVGQALMGANNTMDPRNLRRMEDKYKPGSRR